jgi:hypothetical protein
MRMNRAGARGLVVIGVSRAWVFMIVLPPAVGAAAAARVVHRRRSTDASMP